MNKLNRLYILLAMLFITIGSVDAQLLWKVTKKGQPTSYIFGTHHLIPKDILDDKPEVIKALKSCDIIIGEIDIAEMQDMTKMSKYMQAMTLPSDSMLSTLLSEKEFNLVKSELTKAMPTIPATAVNSFRPTAISTFLSAAYGAKAVKRIYPNYNPALGIDIYIQSSAKENNKRIAGLETLEYQTNILLKNKSFDKSKSDLLKLLNCGNDKIEAAMYDMTLSYIEGDINRLYELTKDEEICPGLKMDKADIELLLTNRNNNWVEILPSKYLSKNSCFIAVGALHLPGDIGIINLLKKAGYTVTPVTMK